jgi:hypothetical protein
MASRGVGGGAELALGRGLRGLLGGSCAVGEDILQPGVAITERAPWLLAGTRLAVNHLSACIRTVPVRGRSARRGADKGAVRGRIGVSRSRVLWTCWSRR